MKKIIVFLLAGTMLLLSGCKPAATTPERAAREAVVHNIGTFINDEGQSQGYGLDLSLEDALTQLKQERANLQDIGSVDYELITHILNLMNTGGISCYDSAAGEFYYTLYYTNTTGEKVKTHAEIGFCESSNPVKNIKSPLLTLHAKTENSIAINFVSYNHSMLADDTAFATALFTHLYGEVGAAAIMKLDDAENGVSVSFTLNGHTVNGTSTTASVNNTAMWDIWDNLIPVIDSTDVIRRSAKQAIDDAGGALDGAFVASEEQQAWLNSISRHDFDQEAMELSDGSQLIATQHEPVEFRYIFEKTKVRDAYHYSILIRPKTDHIQDTKKTSKLAEDRQAAYEGAELLYHLSWTAMPGMGILQISNVGIFSAGYAQSEAETGEDFDLWGFEDGLIRRLVDEVEIPVFGSSVMTENAAPNQTTRCPTYYDATSFIRETLPAFQNMTEEDELRSLMYHAVSVDDDIHYIFQTILLCGQMDSISSLDSYTADNSLWGKA